MERLRRASDGLHAERGREPLFATPFCDAASRSLLVTHANAPLSIEGRRRLVERCKTRPIAHVAAEMVAVVGVGTGEPPQRPEVGLDRVGPGGIRRGEAPTSSQSPIR